MADEVCAVGEGAEEAWWVLGSFFSIVMLEGGRPM